MIRAKGLGMTIRVFESGARARFRCLGSLVWRIRF